MKKPLTMQNLAALSGIPRVTISRVLNGYPHISDEMRNKVNAVIQRHGYEANILARSLVMKKTNLLAIVIPDIRISFYSRIVDQVEKEVLAKGMNLLPFDSYFDPERERRLLALIHRLQVDALIIAPVTSKGELVNREPITRFRKPVVFFDRHVSFKGASVLLDNNAAGRLAATHLLSLGHRRLAMLESSEDESNVCVQDRREGFARAIRKHGCTFDRKQIFRLDWPTQTASLEYGYALTKASLSALQAQGITAFFAYTDSIALGAIRALHEAGIRVPEDLSVIGCDDLDFAAYVTPPLTTIHQPTDELAKALVKDLKERNRCTCTMIAPRLVERASCARAR
jgi:DNA-binding LacI/PurR family transcriptional regulator